MIRVKTTFTGVTGSPYFSQFNFIGNDGTDSVANANASLTATKNFWVQMNGAMATSLSWTHLGTCDVVDPASGKITAQVAGTTQTGAGTGGTSMLPQEVQALIRWDTGLYPVKRRLVGHTFVPGLVQGACASNGSPAALMTTCATNAIPALLTAPTLVKFVIWHRPAEGATTGGVTAVPGSGSLGTKFAVLKSRRD